MKKYKFNLEQILNQSTVAMLTTQKLIGICGATTNPYFVPTPNEGVNPLFVTEHFQQVENNA